MKPYVIFAPHIDDELIGCWSLIRAKEVDKVYYFFDITTERKREAIQLAFDFGYDVFFNADATQIDDAQTLLVPNIRDQHPHHKIVNYSAKHRYPGQKKKYYSIDMNYGTILLKDYEDKKKALLTYFPSQAALFNNGKYYLFESIQDLESEKFYKVEHNNNTVETTLSDIDMHATIRQYLFTCKTIEEIEMRIQANWPMSVYRIEFNNQIIYSGEYK